MIDFFDNFSFWGKTRKYQLLDRFYIYTILRNISIWAANILLPIYFKITSKNPEYKITSTKPLGGRYIVSLTTFPLRIKSIYLVIESMLRQSRKPDKIILYLSSKQFPDITVLPKNLLAQQERGLQIELVAEDMRSHKKYLYAMKDYSEDNIITIDDDVIYRSDFIHSLVEFSEKFPACIIGNRCKIISEPYCYNSMRDAKEKDALIPRNDLLNIGASGVLYPPHSLFEDWHNEELIRELCFTADDIWLCCMARLKDTKVVFTDYFQNQLIVLIKNNISLREVNLEANQIQLNALVDYYTKKLNRNPFAKNILK